MAYILYNTKGEEVKVNYAIDRQAALDSGKYYEQNPLAEVSTKMSFKKKDDKEDKKDK